MIIKLLIIASGILMYVKGECETKWLGKPSQAFKTFMGAPIALWCWISYHSWISLLPIATYAFATVVFGYGDKNPWTKWFGKEWAIIITGIVLGLASVTMIHLWCIAQSIISGVAWHYIHVMDDEGLVKEPRVAIYRAVGGLCLILPFLSLR